MQTLLEYLGSDVTSMRSSGKPKKNLKAIHVGRSYNDARFHRIASRSAVVEQNFDTPNQAFISLPCTTSK